MTDDAFTPRRFARGTLLALAATVALAFLAGPVASPAAAHAGAYQLTLEANEDCADRTYCFDVVEGSLDEIAQGEEVKVTLVNNASNDLDHNVYITQLGQASEDRDTDASAAEMNTENVSPGEQASLEYFVSQGTEGLYLWCDVGVHESQGMYLEVPLTEDASTNTDGETNGSPAPGALVGLLALAGVALALRREA